ncbi:TetR/AcrR family transcriptional regulator [Nocardia seriolae]|uniref:HTH tetR-type domain-containing protein n=1 Tax=Nocardia seriolae TaxID=37332 RepID=A0ABC9Z6V3_9NOCA|nr:TetR/AcrR family transcriptional regulator [Nocardia seriolae]APA99259.1 hypothetical protein NS506_05213 [Nocardia seriolae]PSK32881.1 TetR/AcrR family transcriptional regulator [Nocardia seriolae]QOW35063.1 TetR/AcrR family transcriptional regulator [Nocardia seriolae]QUN17473.1 TetR/AcrR family transcriptional regulator [Nocardia seriolae]WNJ62327.1 TetR/AcrR family transcriptional regulator [Nocardia seriolae]
MAVKGGGSEVRRGRPPKSEEERNRVRQEILQATVAVYVERGRAGLTVERIAAAAGMSKPTYYKYFPNSTAALSELFEVGNKRLRDRIEQAVAQQDDLFGKINAGIDAYLDWADEVGDILLVFRAEELGSPTAVADLRAESDSVYTSMMDVLATNSNVRLSPEMVAMLLAAFQSGARQYQADRSRRASIKEGMLRITAAAMWSGSGSIDAGTA